MSYDISINAKIEGVDRYTFLDEPTYSSPTYNLRDMFVACMNWEYRQGEYYKCSEIIGNINRGIDELTNKRNEYKKYNPSNGWGNIDDALLVLKSIYKCIYEQDMPLEYLYLRW